MQEVDGDRNRDRERELFWSCCRRWWDETYVDCFWTNVLLNENWRTYYERASERASEQIKREKDDESCLKWDDCVVLCLQNKKMMMKKKKMKKKLLLFMNRDTTKQTDNELMMTTVMKLLCVWSQIFYCFATIPFVRPLVLIKRQKSFFPSNCCFFFQRGALVCAIFSTDNKMAFAC